MRTGGETSRFWSSHARAFAGVPIRSHPVEIVVPGIHEPLQQLEPSRCLRPAAGLDLLADATFVTFVHGLDLTFVGRPA